MGDASGRHAGDEPLQGRGPIHRSAGRELDALARADGHFARVAPVDPLDTELGHPGSYPAAVTQEPRNLAHIHSLDNEWRPGVVF